MRPPCARRSSPRTRRARRWRHSRRMRAATCSNIACAASASAARNSRWRCASRPASRSSDARGEVTRLIDTFRIAAGEATRIDGEVIELQISRAHPRLPRHGQARADRRRAAFITPFNFPLNLVAHKVAPAIAAGCPFVLKPAAKTPIGALIIGEVLAETDLPKGAFSILPCSNEDAGAAGRGRAHRPAQLHRRPGRLGPEGARRTQEGDAGTGRQRRVHRRRRSRRDARPRGRAPGVRRVLPVAARAASACSASTPTPTSTTSCARSSRPRSASCAWAIRATRRPSSAR